MGMPSHLAIKIIIFVIMTWFQMIGPMGKIAWRGTSSGKRQGEMLISGQKCIISSVTWSGFVQFQVMFCGDELAEHLN